MLDNTYDLVTEPATAFLLLGNAPSNTYIGRSRAYDPVYEQITVERGDEVHKLVGGTFLVRDGACLGELRWQLREQHLFERGGIDRQIEPDTLTALARPTVPQGGYRHELPTYDQAWVYSHATAYGRGPVWVVTRTSDGNLLPLADGKL